MATTHNGSDGRFTIGAYPEVDFQAYRDVDFLESPDYIITSSYDFEQIEAALDRGVLSADYSLPRPYHSEWSESQPPSPGIFSVFEELRRQSRYRLLSEHAPVRRYAPIEFPPPTIRIYRRLDLP